MPPRQWTAQEKLRARRHLAYAALREGFAIDYRKPVIAAAVEAVENLLESQATRNALNADIDAAVAAVEPGYTLPARVKRLVVIVAVAKLLADEIPGLLREV